MAVFAEWARLPEGWSQNVLIDWDQNGTLIEVLPDATDTSSAQTVKAAIPAQSNLHSHAFQRAMAGLAEVRSRSHESFWTWRENMYRLVHVLTPDQLYTIARALYIEMLQAGFAHVAEFHYLHNATAGQEGPQEMADALIAAASEAGIGLTLLPVLYRQGGFEKPPEEAQLPFCLTPERHSDLVLRLVKNTRKTANVVIGQAVHSLRAVPTYDLMQLALSDLAATAPFHIHAAEQMAEVDDCKQALGARPVEWLLDNAPLGPNWTLIHATHMTQAESENLARSGAVAGLCPITEANLGDGLFNLPLWLEAQAPFGIGSDSNVRIDPFDELRLLEYGQRLTAQKRLIGADELTPNTGARLWLEAAKGGARSCGIRAGEIAVGQQANLLSLNLEHRLMAGRQGDAWLDTAIFAGGPDMVDQVIVNGKQQVSAGYHPLADVAFKEFSDCLDKLRQDL